jgi:hypothetical protein
VLVTYDFHIALIHTHVHYYSYMQNCHTPIIIMCIIQIIYYKQNWSPILEAVPRSTGGLMDAMTYAVVYEARDDPHKTVIGSQLGVVSLSL